MNGPLDMPSLRWRSLADMDRLYTSRLRWDEFLAVTKLMDLPCFEERVAQLKRPPIDAEDLLTNHLDLFSEELEQARAVTARLRLHIMHQMIHDAADGIWFAFAKSPPSLRHELVPPDIWRMLLLDPSKGVAWREPSLRFEDLKCAYTRDLPSAHPVVLVIQEARDATGLPPLIIHSPIHSPPVALTSPEPDIHTGKPGRPSPKGLYLDELRRRVSDDQLEKSKGQQAKALQKWLLTNHPTLKKPAVETIENNITKIYNDARSAACANHETK